MIKSTYTEKPEQILSLPYYLRSSRYFLLKIIEINPKVLLYFPELYKRGEQKVEWLKDESFMKQAVQANVSTIIYSGLDPAQIFIPNFLERFLGIKSNEDQIGLSNEQILNIAGQLNTTQITDLAKRVGEVVRLLKQEKTINNKSALRSLKHFQNLDEHLFKQKMLKSSLIGDAIIKPSLIQLWLNKIKRGETLKGAPEEIINNKSILLRAVRKNFKNFQYASDELKKDCSFYFEIQEISPAALSYFNFRELVKSVDFVNLFFEKFYYIPELVSESIRNNIDNVIRWIKVYPTGILNASKEIKEDPDKILELIKIRPNILHWLPDFLSDNDFIQKAANANPESLIISFINLENYCPNSLSQNELLNIAFRLEHQAQIVLYSLSTKWMLFVSEPKLLKQQSSYKLFANEILNPQESLQFLQELNRYIYSINLFNMFDRNVQFHFLPQVTDG